MPSKKKTAEPKAKVEKVDTSTSTATHGPNDAVTAPDAGANGVVEETEERASAYQTEHFTVQFKNGKAHVAPINWVGPAPLVFAEDRLGELSDLLARANHK